MQIQFFKLNTHTKHVTMLTLISCTSLWIIFLGSYKAQTSYTACVHNNATHGTYTTTPMLAMRYDVNLC
jgi:hypothetical protein